jgi:hypothetical protein
MIDMLDDRVRLKESAEYPARSFKVYSSASGECPDVDIDGSYFVIFHAGRVSINGIATDVRVGFLK